MHLNKDLPVSHKPLDVQGNKIRYPKKSNSNLFASFVERIRPLWFPKVYGIFPFFFLGIFNFVKKK